MTRIRNLLYPGLIAASVLFSCKKTEVKSVVETGSSPLADAGYDHRIGFPLDSVLLDGTNSTDKDGKILKWTWTDISSSGRYTKIKHQSLAKTVVVFYEVGVYQYQLKVQDDKDLFDLDTVSVIVEGRSGSPLSPIANAGPDQVIYSSSIITLDGSKSTDPDGNIQHYYWRQVSGPLELTVVQYPLVTEATNAIPGNYVFELMVVDRDKNFSLDSVQVTVTVFPDCNGLPVRTLKNLSLVQIGALSKFRTAVNAAAAGDFILFAGGHDVPEYGSTRVDLYNTKTKSWSTAELSKRRFDMAAIASGNLVFFAGGRLGDGAFDELFNTVDIFDVTKNKWSVQHLSQKRAYIGAATIKDEVFFAGGEMNQNYNTSDRVDIFNTRSGIWTTHSLSQPRAFVAGVSMGNRLFFGGGQMENRWYAQPSMKIDQYDATNHTWSVSNLGRPMGWPSAIADGNAVYWVDRCIVEAHDVVSNEKTATSLSKSMGSFHNGEMAFAKNGLLFFANSDGPLFFEIFDPLLKTWTNGILPVQIMSPTLVSLNGEIYVTGIEGSEHGVAKVWKLDR